MTRVKRGTIAHKRRKSLLKHAKGFKYGRKNKYRQAKEALTHAWSHAFKDRKRKKRETRRLWTTKINAFCRKEGLTYNGTGVRYIKTPFCYNESEIRYIKTPFCYNSFIKLLMDKNIKIDRKIIAQLAENEPQILKEIIDQIKK